MVELEWNIYHPFHIHSGKSTHQVLSEVLLEGSNYYTWSREVKRSLDSKNKLCFIVHNSNVATE